MNKCVICKLPVGKYQKTYCNTHRILGKGRGYYHNGVLHMGIFKKGAIIKNKKNTA